MNAQAGARPILCVVSARGGSQGVPGKNVRPILGRSLIARAIATALASSAIDRVVVSTDSPAIAAEAERMGAEVPFMRPAELATSSSGKFQVWQHALQACEVHYGRHFDLYVDLDCTNPLIEPGDVDGAVARFEALRAGGVRVDAVFTVARARRNPYFNIVEPDESGALRMSKSTPLSVVARQNAPVAYDHVAGVYVLDTAYIRRASHLLDGQAFGYEVGEEKAHDVDSECDFQMIEFLLSQREASGRR